ncbi:hypothetical protein BD309DRAFT_984901, partial [Dichomitus squalens]
MSLDYALEDSFNAEVERLLTDPAVSDMALHSQAQEYLQVYDEPSFGEIKFLRARYVSAAICACASHAKSAVACSQDQPKSVAEALGRLASVWLAFVLWPFYCQAMLPAKPSGEDSDSGDTTPTGRSEDLSRNTVAYRRWAVLRDEVGQFAGLYLRSRLGCFMSGAVLYRTPEEALLGVFTTALLVTHIIGVPARARLRHYDQ